MHSLVGQRFIPYLEYARLSFLELVTYRLRYLMGILTYMVHVSVYWFIWEAAYVGQTSIGGFSLPEITTYVAVGWIARSFYFNNVDWDVYEQVNQGKIALDLIKPVDFQMMHFARAIGESVFRLFLFSFPAGAVICLVFPVMAPDSSWAFWAFVGATLIALLINLQINFLIGLLAFRVRSVLGIMRAKYVTMQLLTGLTIPITFYPEKVQQIFFLTPFPYIAQVPLSLYLGKYTGEQLLQPILVASSWLLILFVIGRLMWNRCLRTLIVHGG